MQKVDYSKISPELRKKLEELDKKRPENQQLQVLQDIAMMFQEVIMSSDDKQKDTDKVIKDFGAVLIDARENLQKIANKEDKEFPEFPDIAKPITEVLDKLIKAVESKEYSPKIDVKVPEIKVPKSTINIDAPDLKGIEKLLKTEVPKAFEEAISKIPQTEIPEYPDRWDEVLKWLEDIDTATRMRPIPGSMSINNTSSNPVPITGDVTVDTTGLATVAKQDDIIAALGSLGAVDSDYSVNDIEDGTTSYFGKSNSSADYLIVKVTDTSVSYATITNNGGVATYTDAWTNKATLTYGRKDQAF